jgi:hypothetical protein
MCTTNTENFFAILFTHVPRDFMRSDEEHNEKLPKAMQTFTVVDFFSRQWIHIARGSEMERKFQKTSQC